MALLLWRPSEGINRKGRPLLSLRWASSEKIDDQQKQKWELFYWENFSTISTSNSNLNCNKLWVQFIKGVYMKFMWKD
jgi:hypothetical protein